ncbi:MAG: DUF1080 domain-containing protein [Planctomycetes bacterium]|nr:DUF1080 domain-containing protein [Planctomycetota bacterium]
MKTAPFLSRAAVLLLAIGGALASTQDAPPAGFVALFNGRDLEGWFGRATEDPRALWQMAPEALAAHREKTRADLRRHWRVAAGELVNDGTGLYATTVKDYRDFELWLEYRTVAGADSGVYLRGCPQVQIWDTTEAGGKWPLGADKGSGGLWNNRPGAPGKDPLRKMDRPFGEWNALRILMVGPRVTVWLNGANVVDDAVMENYFDRSRPIFAAGPIQLQTHGGEIRWRNLYLREIDAEEANRRHRARHGGGFEPLFNGRDFAGWRGADGYEITDGVLVCTEQGGTLFTDRPYADYAFDFEFGLGPGANNGLTIHYPGRGNPAHDGVELQILDDSAPAHAGLQPWQYHGSAYGIKAARRGYLRPVGEWNYQCVTCRGARVEVELNGYPILDLDLEREPAADGQEHPGAARRSGHLGFFGHETRVTFRNIRLKRLAQSD